MMPNLEHVRKLRDGLADTATSVADSAQDTLQKTSEKVADTASSAAGAVQDASQKAAVNTTDVAASALWSAQDGLQEASEKVTGTAASVAGSAQDASQRASEALTDTASSVADSVQEAADEAASATVAAAEHVTSGAKGAVEATTGAVQDAAHRAPDVATAAVEQVTGGAKGAVGATTGAVRETAQKVPDVANVAAGQVTGGVKGAVGVAAGGVREAARQAPDMATAAVEKVTGGARGALQTTTDVVQGAAQKTPDIATAAAEKVTSDARTTLQSTTGAAQNAAQKAPVVAMAAVDSVKTDPKAILEATRSAANALLSTTQGILASDLAGVANDLVQEMVKGVPTVYDKAMDAEFIRTGIGGSWHRLFDGGHTIGGAWNAARGALPDDTIIEEARGTIQGLLRDVSTPRGLPLATWDKETFDQVTEALESNLHIPQDWFRDLNTYDVPDLISSSVGAVSVIFSWNNADTEAFARLVGSMGLSAAVGANPLLLIVSVVALSRAFQNALATGDYVPLVDGLVKGGLSSGATLAAVGIVGFAGGPASVGLIASLVVGVLTQKASQNVSLVNIGQVVAGQAVAAATEAKGMIAQQVPVTL